MKTTFALLVFLSALPLMATHIVGGEFQMKHIAADIYKFDLIIYFDEVNGNPGAKDLEARARIFSNFDNSVMANVTLPLVDEVAVSYLNPSCASGLFLIRRMTYSTILSLNPDVFNDPHGYYIAWERCCRNYNTTNIYSEDPNMGSMRYAGQTFILEFPPVVRDGTPFINSSPVFNLPYSDYACVGQEYFAELQATDVDGDSLVYTIQAPLNTHSGDALPFPDMLPRSKPYPSVGWRPGFDQNNIMNGNPDLNITENGILSAVPTKQGLFVYAVKCEEYRNKIKIGEVRRDFQILVMSCTTAAGPVISGKALTGTYSDADLEVSFNNETPNSQRCIVVKVEDTDALLNSFVEQINLRAIPINGDFEVSTILPAVTTAALDQNNPFAEFQICFDRCSPTDANDFTVGLVAYDNTCPVALTDTIRVHVTLDPSEFCQPQSIVFPPLADVDSDYEPFLLTATASSGLPVTFNSEDETTASVTGATLTLHAAGQVRIKATQSGGDNFKKAPPVVQRLCIKPKPPILTQQANTITSDYYYGVVWYKDGNALFESNVPILHASSIGSYSARVVIKDCISDESSVIVITENDLPVTTGVDDRLTETFKAYPNPTDHSLTVTGPWIQRPMAVEILNLSCQSLVKLGNPVENQTVDIHHLPPGIYVLKVHCDGEVFIQKIVKK